MSSPDADKVFAGSIPGLYESHLVPLLFEPYAADLVSRLVSLAPSRVLEVAAGTGVVTRAMASALPEGVSVVATDLNQAMLDHAAAAGAGRAVEWRQADATHLPFPDGAFDAVVCQFGVMFFPDRPRAFAEARRVLRPGGVLLFNVWDRIAENEFADTVEAALERVFPEDPPRFLSRAPYGYHDLRALGRDLAEGGFAARPRVETLAARSIAPSPLAPAVGFCQGSPLRNEIEARDPSGLGAATERAAEAIAGRFGRGEVDGKMQAHVIAVER